jgi:hypothetical protein
LRYQNREYDRYEAQLNACKPGPYRVPTSKQEVAGLLTISPSPGLWMPPSLPGQRDQIRLSKLSLRFQPRATWDFHLHVETRPNSKSVPIHAPSVFQSTSCGSRCDKEAVSMLSWLPLKSQRDHNSECIVGLDSKKRFMDPADVLPSTVLHAPNQQAKQSGLVTLICRYSTRSSSRALYWASLAYLRTLLLNQAGCS